jgi:GTP cyclohydrolase IA
MTKKKVDQEKIEKAVRSILQAIGEDPNREGLKRTPQRVAAMYAELFGGYHDDPARHLRTFFTERYDEIVILRDIPFHSICEHHLMPFVGKAHIAYLPDGRVIGISKLARLVETFSHRLQVQERLTTQVADMLMEYLKPKGVVVIMSAQHTCMTIRGVKKPGSSMITSALRGIFKTNLASRTEILSLLKD